METAVVRSRFADLLRQKSLGKKQGENPVRRGNDLVARPIVGSDDAAVLDTIHPPEHFVQTLTQREGPWWPYLARVEKCEVS